MRTQRHSGFTLIELLIVVAIIGIVAAIAIPNLQGALRRAKYTRAAADTKQAAAQAVTYANDKAVYPSSLKLIRDNYYVNVPDDDPWGTPYQLSPALQAGSAPAVSDDIYIYSKGSNKSGVYPDPFAGDTGAGGSVGYSSVYGLWTGS